MKTTDRVLPAFAFALLGAFLGALACAMVVLKTDVTFASLPLFGGVGALVLGLVGFLKGPSGPGYVAPTGRRKPGSSADAHGVKVFGRDVGDAVQDVNQPCRDE